MLIEIILAFARLQEMTHVVDQMNFLEPVTISNPLPTRFQLAGAIVDATDDLDERALLVSIAKWESFFREDVLRCSRRGGGVALGPWQVVPRSDLERKTLCSDLTSSAKLVLRRVAESRRLCKELPARDQLAIYAAGDCASKEGRMLSRMRIDTALKAKELLR